MKLYEMVFSDPEQGFIRQWRRNKKEVANLTTDWYSQHPLREIMTIKFIEIPTDKIALIDWLNQNARRTNS